MTEKGKVIMAKNINGEEQVLIKGKTSCFEMPKKIVLAAS
jgi:hypothetical protein